MVDRGHGGPQRLLGAPQSVHGRRYRDLLIRRGEDGVSRVHQRLSGLGKVEAGLGEGIDGLDLAAQEREPPGHAGDRPEGGHLCACLSECVLCLEEVGTGSGQVTSREATLGPSKGRSAPLAR